MAVEHANLILSWQENLVEDEIPPVWMWALDEELNDWFEKVDRDRKAKYGGGDDDYESDSMTQNELANNRR
jgi:hypothetical protein